MKKSLGDKKKSVNSSVKKNKFEKAHNYSATKNCIKQNYAHYVLIQIWEE